ncbi:DMT family transporter [Anianabacter salinae]|uniref:DMT family transporter n=1 Tax=Anianabacter salinae TaxID=2851023 RepID=UPI00225E0BE5|nr:DMT family transporter [Anianabacter salinae]MBV0913701.1 DMT family transporter [Anianabacter salinae]
MADKPRSGVLFALGAFGFFATHDALVKALGAGYSPFQVMFFAMVFGFPLIAIMLISDPQAGTLRPVNLRWMLIRTVLGVTVGLTAFTAFALLPLAQVYAIIFAQPLIITALSVPVLGEKVGPYRWAAIFVGLCGVLIVIRPGSAPLGMGHLAAVIASIGGALVAVILRKFGSSERSAVLILYPMIGNFILAGAVLGFVYRPMPLFDLGLSAALALCAFVASLCMILAYRYAPAAIVSPMQYSQILWAAVYGAVFFAEYPDTWTIVGSAVIIASGLFIVARETGGGRSVIRPITTARLLRGDTVAALRLDSFLKRSPRRK